VRYIRVGAPDFISVRPLIFGITRRQAQEVDLVYKPPGLLADAVSRRELDAALVPSIDYLRGEGSYFLEGPAHIAKPAPGSLILLARQPLNAIARIAVDEFCRSPISATRIVLAEKFGLTPDLCVRKDPSGDWCNDYDGVLLTGDGGLRYLAERSDRDLVVYDIAAIWNDLTSLPLVLGVWVYNDKSLKGQLTKVMVLSRNLGMRSLSCLADGIAATTPYDGESIYDYLTNCWEYQLTDAAREGLRVFEEYALKYDLIRSPRLAGDRRGITTGGRRLPPDRQGAPREFEAKPG
jgi:chorismate dehydratase